jgi:hypothetical protein
VTLLPLHSPYKDRRGGGDRRHPQRRSP